MQVITDDQVVEGGQEKGETHGENGLAGDVTLAVVDLLWWVSVELSLLIIFEFLVYSTSQCTYSKWSITSSTTGQLTDWGTDSATQHI